MAQLCCVIELSGDKLSITECPNKKKFGNICGCGHAAPYLVRWLCKPCVQLGFATAL